MREMIKKNGQVVLAQQTVDRLDRIDLQHHRSVEGDLIQPIQDRRSAERRHPVAVKGIDQHQQQVLRIVEQRRQ